MTQRVVTKYDFIQVQQAIMRTEPVVEKYVQELIKEGVRFVVILMLILRCNVCLWYKYLQYKKLKKILISPSPT